MEVEVRMRMIIIRMIIMLLGNPNPKKATLNAKAEKGSLSEDVRKVSSPSSINPVITINSRGEGM